MLDKLGLSKIRISAGQLLIDVIARQNEWRQMIKEHDLEDIVIKYRNKK